MILRWAIAIVLYAGLFLVTNSAEAFDIPSYDGFVTDHAGVLEQSDVETLEAELEAYRQETSNEIAILLIPSLEGEVIADLAVEIGRAWGVGTEKNNNGILLLISTGDRELFIATGYGLEGAVPDITAKHIIDREIIPYFKSGDTYGGIVAGVEALKGAIGGEYVAEDYVSEEAFDWDALWGFIVFGFFFVQWLFAILARTKSWWLGGVLGFVLGVFIVLFGAWLISIVIFTAMGLFLDFIISKNFHSTKKTSWWAGGGWGPGGSGGFGGGSSGGGFGGFSGGSFGGGGAGGSW